MFEICCMVDDKKLVKFLKALDGVIVGEPKIRLVRGAKVKGDKVVSAQPTPGADMAENVAKLIHNRHLERVDSKTLRELVTEAGGRPTSFGHIANKLKDMKILGKGKRGSGYAVLANGRA